MLLPSQSLAADEPDTDGDGLPDRIEVVLGTGIDDPDSDDDGVSDGDEYLVHGSDPLKADTDADGMPDKYEIDNGLDPRRDDSAEDHDLDLLTNKEEYTASTSANNPDSDGDGVSDYLEVKGTQGARYFHDKNDRLAGAYYDKGFGIGYGYDGNSNLTRQIYFERDSDGDGLIDAQEFARKLDPNIDWGDNGFAGDRDGDGWTNYQELANNTDPLNAAQNPGMGWSAVTEPCQVSADFEFVPDRFVLATGQLVDFGLHVVALSGDGQPGTGRKNEILLFALSGDQFVLSERISMPAFASVGITSMAVGRLARLEEYGILVGTRQVGGQGTVLWLSKPATTWTSSLVETSLDEAAYVAEMPATGGALMQLTLQAGKSNALYSLSRKSDGSWQIIEADVEPGLDRAFAAPLPQRSARFLSGDRLQASAVVAPDVSGATKRPGSASAYLLAPTTATWSDAAAWAQGLGGKLVVCAGEGESTWVSSTFSATAGTPLWMGLERTGTANRDWRWSNWEPFQFNAGDWGTGEPNNSGGSENRAAIGTGGKWSDVSGAIATYKGVAEFESAPRLLDVAPGNPTWKGSPAIWQGDSLYYLRFQDVDNSGGNTAGDLCELHRQDSSNGDEILYSEPLGSGPAATCALGLYPVGVPTSPVLVGLPSGALILTGFSGTSYPYGTQVFSLAHEGCEWHAISAYSRQNEKAAVVAVKRNPRFADEGIILAWRGCPTETAVWTQWTETLSGGRSSGASASDGKTVAFAGGWGGATGGGYYNRIDVYDSRSQAWSIRELSRSCGQFAGACCQGKAYFGGGLMLNNVVTAAVDVLDFATLERTTAQALTVPRAILAGAAAGNKVYFAGGSDASGSYYTRVDIYDVETGLRTTSELSAPGRNSIGGGAVGDVVIFAGGHNAGGVYKNVDFFNSATGDHASGEYLSQGRFDVAVATAGDRVFFAGGYAGTGFSDVIDVYDSRTNTWSVLNPPLSEAKIVGAAVVLGRYVLFAGGHGSFGYTKKIEIYDTWENVWVIGKELAIERCLLSGGRAGNRALFFGGVDKNNQISALLDIVELTKDAATSSLGEMVIPSIRGPTLRLVNFSAGPGGTIDLDLRSWDGGASPVFVEFEYWDEAQARWRMTSQVTVASRSATDGLTFSSAPGGATHTLSWDIAAELGAGFSGPVKLRVRTTSLGGTWAWEEQPVLTYTPGTDPWTDLRWTSATHGSGSFLPEDTVSLDLAGLNGGTQGVGAFEIQVRLCREDRWDDSHAIDLGRFSVPGGAAAAGPFQAAGELAIPESAGAGPYYLWLKIDPDNAIAESSEGNNDWHSESANVTVKARYHLVANADPAGSCPILQDPAPDANGYYADGTRVTLTAQPEPGYVLDNWSGDLSGTGLEKTITIDGDKSVTAHLTLVTGRILRIVNGSGYAGGEVVVPVELVSLGDENAFGFSVGFVPAILGEPRARLGAGAPAGSRFVVNDTEAAQGKLGIALAAPAETVFAAGQKIAAELHFTIAAGAVPGDTPVVFGVSPVAKSAADVNGDPLPVAYADGQVTVASGLEGDVAPALAGDGLLEAPDWTKAGRYAAGLDVAGSDLEFVRADCAPRMSGAELVRGDGALSVSDWVQAGRYVAGGPADPATPAGGPIAVERQFAGSGGGAPLAAESLADGAGERSVSIQPGEIPLDSEKTMDVRMEMQGNENAAGFSVVFDPAVLQFVSALPGAAFPTATLLTNDQSAAQGRLGLAIALGTGESFPAGTAGLVRLTFRAVATTGTLTTVRFEDAPVRREACDVLAMPLAGVVWNDVDVRVDTPFRLWGFRHFTEEQMADPAVSDPMSDPDHDGHPNFLEYGLGRDPNAPERNSLLIQSISDVAGQRYLTIRYNRRKNATDLEYRVKVSSDLAEWFTGSAYTEEMGTTDLGELEEVTVRDRTPLDGLERRFMKVEVAPPGGGIIKVTH